MQSFPHHYSVAASVTPEGDVALDSAGLSPLRSAPPIEFGGPGDQWSPETLLVAAVADCFVLTFRGIAGASRFAWLSLACDVVGTLERVDGVTQFTQFEIRARLRVPPGAKTDQALRLLTKAEDTCLVTSSLNATPHLDAVVDVETP